MPTWVGLALKNIFFSFIWKSERNVKEVVLEGVPLVKQREYKEKNHITSWLINYNQLELVKTTMSSWVCPLQVGITLWHKYNPTPKDHASHLHLILTKAEMQQKSFCILQTIPNQANKAITLWFRTILSYRNKIYFLGAYNKKRKNTKIQSSQTGTGLPNLRKILTTCLLSLSLYPKRWLLIVPVFSLYYSKFFSIKYINT